MRVTRDQQAIAAAAAAEAQAALDAWRETAVVSRFQAYMALLDAGLLSTVQTALGGADVISQMAWSEANEFHRNSPLVAQIAAGLGLSDAEIDTLFQAAEEIAV